MSHYSEQAKFVENAFQLLRASQAEIWKAIENEKNAPCPDDSDYREVHEEMVKMIDTLDALFGAIDVLEEVWEE